MLQKPEGSRSLVVMGLQQKYCGFTLDVSALNPSDIPEIRVKQAFIFHSLKINKS